MVVCGAITYENVCHFLSNLEHEDALTEPMDVVFVSRWVTQYQNICHFLSSLKHEDSLTEPMDVVFVSRWVAQGAMCGFPVEIENELK